MPKAKDMSRKWLTRDRRAVATAPVVWPRTAEGRSATHEKFVAEVFSKGFSKTKVNSLRRYWAFAAAVVEGSMSAMNVMRRVFLAMRL